MTEVSRRQHVALRQLADELTALLERTPQLDGPEVSTGLERIGSALKAHVEMEVEIMYPRLLEHHDENLRALAAKMAPRIKDVYDGFRTFQTSWSTEKIRGNPDTFRRQARFVIDAVHQSTLHEETALYDRIDGAFGDSLI